MRTYHHFIITAPKPANESGYSWHAIGDGRQIFRWDKRKVYPMAGLKQHFMDGRIGNWQSKSRLPFRAEFSAFGCHLTRGVLNEWSGSCETEYLHTFTYTGDGWKSVKTGYLFPNLFRAIRNSVRCLNINR